MLIGDDQIMKRIGILLLLLCCFTCSFAETSSDTNEATDLSLKYLSQLFGPIGGILPNLSANLAETDQVDTLSNNGMMNVLFNAYNKGVMIVAAIWLFYTISQVLLITATSDSPQKSIKNWLIWLRVVIGFGILVPGTNGYSLVQEVMMQVVKQGVYLGNEVWVAGLDYLDAGSNFFNWITPTGLNNTDVVMPSSTAQSAASNYPGYVGEEESESTNTYEPMPKASTLASMLFKITLCYQLSKNYDDWVRSYSYTAVKPVVSNGSLERYTGTIYFPSYKDSNTSPSNTDGYEASQNQGCGSISLPSTFSYAGREAADGSGAKTMQENYTAAFTVLQTLVTSYMGQAPTVASNSQGNNLVTPVPESAATAYGTALYAYISGMYQNVTPYVSSVQSTADYIDDAKKWGWFNAGAFFWDLYRSNDVVSGATTNVTNVKPSTSGPSSDFTDNGLLPETYFITARAGLDDVVGSSTVAGSSSDINAWYAIQKAFSDSSVAGTDSISSTVLGTSIVTSINLNNMDEGIASVPLANLVNLVSSLISNTPAEYYNPILLSYKVGKICLGQAGYIWQNTITWVVEAGTLAAVVCCSDLFDAVLMIYMPFVVAITGFLFTAGAMMVFYVPFYPYLLFTFGVIGWLLTVLEAMVAAPLVAFGITHPEGHDLLGRAEQALMLGLSVFLRPALMIIGYFAGMTLMYIATGFLNEMLGRVFVSAFAPTILTTFQADTNQNALNGMWSALMQSSTTGGTLQGQFTGSYFADAFCVPLILAFYAFVVLEVCNQCYTAIHAVPDMVLRWIGGPQMQDQTQAMASKIESKMGQAGSQAGQQMGSIGKSSAEGGAKAGAAVAGKAGDAAGEAAKE